QSRMQVKSSGCATKSFAGTARARTPTSAHASRKRRMLVSLALSGPASKVAASNGRKPCLNGSPSASLVDDLLAPLAAERPSLPAEELQVGERLHRCGHHLEAVVGGDRESGERDLVGRHRLASDQLEHGELPHPMEVDQLAGAPAVIFIDGTVGGT